MKSILICVFAPLLLNYEVSKQFVHSNACKNCFCSSTETALPNLVPRFIIFGTNIDQFPNEILKTFCSKFWKYKVLCPVQKTEKSCKKSTRFFNLGIYTEYGYLQIYTKQNNIRSYAHGKACLEQAKVAIKKIY
jgi:hypothetical protein